MRRAKARLRMEQARQHAAEGHSLGETAAAIGMTNAGLKNLLFKVTGTTCWPPIEDPRP